MASIRRCGRSFIAAHLGIQDGLPIGPRTIPPAAASSNSCPQDFVKVATAENSIVLTDGLCRPIRANQFPAPAPPDCAVAGGAGRQDYVIALGAQRGVSGPECVDASRWDCTLEPLEGTNRHAVRLGLRMVRGLANKDGAAIVAARAGAPFAIKRALDGLC
jgi:Helix-hairpin-helix motif